MTINCPICKRKTFDYVSFHDAIGTVEQHGHCDNCGSPNLVLDKKGGLTCCECGTHQEGFFNLQCESGHGNSFSGIERFIVLVPNSEILNKINDSLRMNFEMDIEKNDIFYIHDAM